jgi:hypothetical protein
MFSQANPYQQEQQQQDQPMEAVKPTKEQREAEHARFQEEARARKAEKKEQTRLAHEARSSSSAAAAVAKAEKKELVRIAHEARSAADKQAKEAKKAGKNEVRQVRLEQEQFERDDRAKREAVISINNIEALIAEAMTARFGPVEKVIANHISGEYKIRFTDRETAAAVCAEEKFAPLEVALSARPQEISNELVHFEVPTFIPLATKLDQSALCEHVHDALASFGPHHFIGFRFMKFLVVHFKSNESAAAVCAASQAGNLGLLQGQPFPVVAGGAPQKQGKQGSQKRKMEVL